MSSGMLGRNYLKVRGLDIFDSEQGMRELGISISIFEKFSFKRD